MAELLKNNYNKAYVTRVAKEIKQFYLPFDEKAFIRAVLNKDWEAYELKERMKHIRLCLYNHLPKEYKISIGILMKACPPFGGFEGMFFPDFVETYGMDHWSLSMKALELFTKYSSSEFAVRPFILKDEERMMKQMLLWSKSKNVHVRRLASEGCRPRLPWAIALPPFKKNPKALKLILENLKNDSEDYVYRSVANNINDIAKDHPDFVIKLCKKWQKEKESNDWLIKHALRTLLKAGNTEALALMGFKDLPFVEIKNFNLSHKVLDLGDSIEMDLDLAIKKKGKFNVRLEFAVDYRKANGKTKRKVFQWLSQELAEGISSFRKKHLFKNFSTRKHYEGVHGISVIVNGHEKASKNFTLKI